MARPAQDRRVGAGNQLAAVPSTRCCANTWTAPTGSPSSPDPRAGGCGAATSTGAPCAGSRRLPAPTPRIAAARAGPTRADLYGLRHSHKTWLIADGAPEIAQARRLGHHLDDRVVETYSHVAPEVEQRLLDGLEACWHAASAYLHPRHSATTFRTLLQRVGHWPTKAA